MHIDRYSLRFFVSRWLDKARRARSKDGLVAFDKFMFTYIAFNTLYNTAAYLTEGQESRIRAHCWPRGGLGKPLFQKHRNEKSRASSLVVAVGGLQLCEAILKKRKDIEKICGSLGPGALYLNEKTNGEPDFEADRRMVEKVKQNNVAELLALIYLVRCNFFHGEKALSPIQNSLLMSCKNVLATASEQLLCAIERRTVNDDLSL